MEDITQPRVTMRELFDDIAGQAEANPMEAARRSSRAVQRKRFYADAGVGEADGGYPATLDGKPIKTPSGRMVVVPARSLAEMIAAEWNAQGEFIEPLTMPLTRFANSVVQGVVDQAEAVRDDVAKYFASDLLFYRVAHPGGRRGAPRAPWVIAALHVITGLTGSALLALALFHGVINPDQVWAAAHVDEDWNAEKWGVDDEVAARKAAKLVDFNAAAAALKELRQAGETRRKTGLG